MTGASSVRPRRVWPGGPRAARGREVALAVAFAIGAAACSTDPGVSGPGGTAGSGGSGAGPGGGTGGTGVPFMEPTFVSGGAGGGGGPLLEGMSPTCKNIDIVFSIDNSSSMAEEQMVMATTIFPAFATRLQSLSAQLESFRMGVLDACPLPAEFNTRGRGSAMTAGGVPCNFSSGKPWIESTSRRLADEFACVGAILTAGKTCTGNNDDEQPASTAAAALEAPAITGANAGFLRDKAVLVVVAMTDEDEQPVPRRTPQQVYERIIAVKGNKPKLVVFLGIGGARACTGPYGTAKAAVQLKAVTDLFVAQERGVFWDLCTGSLDEGLARVIATIKVACDEAPRIQ